MIRWELRVRWRGQRLRNGDWKEIGRNGVRQHGENSTTNEDVKCFTENGRKRGLNGY